ncbi:Crp/Fnr family transcriptional regulator [Antarcticibacterium flavum]|uniref:Crp/Fnr family transcriptional regulator n=1 Tax=Antarcticibacterium flavum TaxID=2058175 RepID=A0A5B7WZF5_9FLAO|nr:MULTISPECIES: Crp/Fnr family transcriptional regulator [Antarcticibacterium]MCM4161233.1 cyclic nucleotide-binding protein [Antarcticibacterium sp. W02-3]QCY68450.1 Crp/Fnr family transcriptional regulator [Antarcticibacterium flavum]
MFEFLYKKVNETITISEEDFEFAKTLFIPKKLRKKRFVLQDGDPCKYTIFVEKGLLRSYTIDEKGSDHILQFAMQGWWSADLYSFLTGEPSEYNIEALEDSELLLITKPSWDILLENVPAFERYFRILIQNNLIATQRRLMGTFSTTAEERYQKLLEDFPDISQRVPQHMIASYIGITRETLSRIRNQIATGS